MHSIIQQIFVDWMNIYVEHWFSDLREKKTKAFFSNFNQNIMKGMLVIVWFSLFLKQEYNDLHFSLSELWFNNMYSNIFSFELNRIFIG